ncbi:hypothetical protein [Bacteroides sp. GM023]|uniref:hypothetical protein n=1 Tax=Bacteroides sp. GM023 TaxID=2723058 RepID=UPI00168A58CC|nr:hypothetical protein [Bacteroides sp. GM023]MBD3588293.1 hypothetical protein [Bacteroides sp. GM023]
MVKEKRETYEFLGNLVVSLMNMDGLFTYGFFEKELCVSPKKLSEMRQGEDEYIYQYVRLLRCILEYINLVIWMDKIQEQLRVVLDSHYDLVIAAVPHGFRGAIQPGQWETVLQWDGVIL